MDARKAAARTAARLTIGLCSLLGGCALLGPQQPAARQEPSEPRRADEHSQIVKDAPRERRDAAKLAAEHGQPDGPAEPAEQKIRDYIARMEGAERRPPRDSSEPAREPGGDVPADAAETRTDVRHGSGSISEVRAEPLGLRSEPRKSAGSPVRGSTALAADSVVSPPARGADASQQPAPNAKPTPATPPIQQPPVLVGVSARGDTGGAPGISAPLQSPAVNAPTAAAASSASIGELVEQLTRGADASFGRQLDARLLHVMAGDYEKAREPLTLVSKEQSELAARFVEATIAIREGHLGDPGGAASSALRELDKLTDALRKVSELSIPTLAICREVRGFGQYQPIEPPQFPAGVASEFVVYCEVRDFVSDKGGDGLFLTRFELRTAVLNKSGDAALEITDGDVVDRSRNRRRDCFIPRLVRLPATLSPGEYVVKVTIIDKLGDKAAEAQSTIRVVAR